MLTVPMSRYKQFEHDPSLGKRWGQAFYDFMQFEKVTNPFDKAWCDQLYVARDVIARQMVLNVIDHAN